MSERESAELRRAATALRSEQWPSGDWLTALAEWLTDEAERRYHPRAGSDPALKVARIVNGDAPAPCHPLRLPGQEW